MSITEWFSTRKWRSQDPGDTGGQPWPFGWVVDSDQFIVLLRRVFDSHQGHVWMFNSDLAIHRDRSQFETLYDRYIKGNSKVLSVRFVVSVRRLEQFLNEAVYKWRFRDMEDRDIGKFLFRSLEEVTATHGGSPVFADFLRTFALLDADGNENVVVFYTVSDNILNAETVTIFRPSIYPFVATDAHGDRRRRALAGKSANWMVVAEHYAAALQAVFGEHERFSRLGVKRHGNGDIHEFTFAPPLLTSQLPANSSAIAPPASSEPELSPARVPSRLTVETDAEATAPLGVTIANADSTVPLLPSAALTLRAPTARTDASELTEFLLQRTTLELETYRIVGKYVRYDERARNVLGALLDEIRVTLGSPDRWKARNNFLLWAAPGTGKTGLVHELGAHVEGRFATKYGLNIKYIHEKLSNLNDSSLKAFIDRADSLLSDPNGRVLALLDEIDKKPGAEWPLPMMLGPLEWNSTFGRPIVWLFAGSVGFDEADFEETLRALKGGGDFLRRVNRPPTVVPRLTALDRVIIACSHIVSEQSGIVECEKRALLFLAGPPGDAGEVVERAGTALKSLKQEIGRTRLYLTHCIKHGSRADEQFQADNRAELDRLGDAILRVIAREP